MGIFSKQEKPKLKGMNDITFTVYTERTAKNWKVWVVEEGHSNRWEDALPKNRKVNFSFRWEAKGWGRSRVKKIRKNRRRMAARRAREGTQRESFKM